MESLIVERLLFAVVSRDFFLEQYKYSNSIFFLEQYPDWESAKSRAMQAKPSKLCANLESVRQVQANLNVRPKCAPIYKVSAKCVPI